MMARAQALGTPADWLVRAKHNRCLPDGDGEKLWAHTSAGAALGEITFTMPARDEQKSRKVRQQLWTRQISISNGKAGTVSATCIVAREIDAPKGVKPVEWRLLTNRAAPTLADAIELIDWYRARWEIEIYFKLQGRGAAAVGNRSHRTGAGIIHDRRLAGGLSDARWPNLPEPGCGLVLRP